MLQDIRYALRSLAFAPAFTAAAVLTLALGLGANTAIFSVVDGVLLKPLPYRDPAKLATIWDTYPPLYPKLGVSPLEREALEKESALFEETAWYRYVPKNLNLIEPGAAALELHAAIISSSLIPMLGATPALGHGFGADESPQSVLLSDRLWKAHFGGDVAVIGRTIHLDDQAFTIVGVMRAGFAFPESADIWLPKGPLLNDELTNPVRHSLGFLARLRPGVTQAQAKSRVDAIFVQLAAEHPSTSKGFGVQIATLQDDLTASARPALLMLLGAVGLVLLIACGNVANLLLSRATGRTKEIAIRTALGASKGRLMRLLLTESLLLALAGGALGLLLAVLSVNYISPVRAAIDSSVLLFLFLVSTAAGIAFGLAPVIQAKAIDPMTAMKSGSSARGKPSMLRGTVVVAEFGFTLIVVIAAGILTKSFLLLVHVDPGFNPRGVLTVRLSWPPSRDPKALFTRMEERLKTLAGIDAVAASNALPLIADRATAFRFNVPGNPLINPDALPVAQIRAVSPDYFRAMQIPLKSGRTLTIQDLPQPVVMINESMARRFWPTRDPVGVKFITGSFGPKPTWSTIVGVVGDVKQFGLDSEPTMDVYFPSAAPTYLILKSTADPQSLAAAVQRELVAIDPGLAVSQVLTMQQVLDQSSDSRRWTTSLLGAFAILALTLALVGIYGVLSWTVSQRTKEIGIRVALGADAGQVRSMVFRYAVKLCVVGLAIGLGGSFALRRYLASLTFHVSTADPWMYGAATLRS